MKLNIAREDGSNKLMERIKAHEGMHTRFRASQVFKEMSMEVKKYEQYKKKQGLR